VKDTGPSRPLLPGIRRIVTESHRAASTSSLSVPTGPDDLPSTEAAPETDARGRPIPEVRADELAGEPWLDALVWHSPEEAAFPGDYGIVLQPFLAGPEQTGFKDNRGAPLTYLVLYVTGIVGAGGSLPPETVQAAFRQAMLRATQLAKGLSQEMQNASVRILLARMPEWMGRKLMPSLRSVRTP
jgi:hypothetical protein